MSDKAVHEQQHPMLKWKYLLKEWTNVTFFKHFSNISFPFYITLFWLIHSFNWEEMRRKSLRRFNFLKSVETFSYINAHGTEIHGLMAHQRSNGDPKNNCGFLQVPFAIHFLPFDNNYIYGIIIFGNIYPLIHYSFRW